MQGSPEHTVHCAGPGGGFVPALSEARAAQPECYSAPVPKDPGLGGHCLKGLSEERHVHAVPDLGGVARSPV